MGHNPIISAIFQNKKNLNTQRETNHASVIELIQQHEVKKDAIWL